MAGDGVRLMEERMPLGAQSILQQNFHLNSGIEGSSKSEHRILAKACVVRCQEVDCATRFREGGVSKLDSEDSSAPQERRVCIQHQWAGCSGCRPLRDRGKCED